MTSVAALRGDELDLDRERATDEIVQGLRHAVGRVLRRRGAVVGLSGGIDSTVTAALCVRAVGAERVLGVLTPEADSDAETLRLSRLAAAALGIDTVLEDITPILKAARCYQRRDEAIRALVPEFVSDWRVKIVLPSVLGNDRLRVFQLVAQAPHGRRVTVRLSADAYRAIVAATNFKQRTRKMIEYHHADRLDYAVIGTPNRLEYDQGFFVKNGDGAADVKPIAHLYKTQVYQLAEYLGVPRGITSRPPTTDTFSLPQSQEEFYFSLPAVLMDLTLHARNAGQPAAEAASELGLAPEQVERAYRDIERKRSTTRYLHTPPLLVEPIAELGLH